MSRVIVAFCLFKCYLRQSKFLGISQETAEFADSRLVLLFCYTIAIGVFSCSPSATYVLVGMSLVVHNVQWFRQAISVGELRTERDVQISTALCPA